MSEKISYQQNIIIEKINSHLQSKGLKQLSKEGVCNGLVLLYLYKGKQWLEHVFNLILHPPDNNLDNVDNKIDELVNSLNWFQDPANYIFDITQHDFDKSIEVIRNPTQVKIFKEYSIASVFKKAELAALLEALKAPATDKLIQIGNNIHAVGVIYRNNVFTLYNPNHNSIEQTFNSVGELVDALENGIIPGI